VDQEEYNRKHPRAEGKETESETKGTKYAKEENQHKQKQKPW
jgi:hypothetical protein